MVGDVVLMLPTFLVMHRAGSLYCLIERRVPCSPILSMPEFEAQKSCPLNSSRYNLLNLGYFLDLSELPLSRTNYVTISIVMGTHITRVRASDRLHTGSQESVFSYWAF